MIPLKDNIPSRSFPVINYVMIGLSTLVFLAQLVESEGGTLAEQYGMIPARVLNPDEPLYVTDVKYVQTGFGVRAVPYQREAAEPLVPVWLTLLTCVFLHGGWMHFIGNMWFLYIFGDNVEDRLGHLGFTVFYLGCGVLASVAHLVSATSSTVPTIGASGAIAGVMGAYFLLYPRAMVLTLVPIFFFLEIVVLPAFFFLGIWFLIQFFQGALAVTSTQTGGVAWWAHIGGFAVGAGAVLLLRQFGKLRPPPGRVSGHASRIGHYRYRRW